MAISIWSLPDDVIVSNILSFLGYRDLLTCIQVCKKLKALASREKLWQAIYVEECGYKILHGRTYMHEVKSKVSSTIFARNTIEKRRPTNFGAMTDFSIFGDVLASCSNKNVSIWNNKTLKCFKILNLSQKCQESIEKIFIHSDYVIFTELKRSGKKGVVHVQNWQTSEYWSLQGHTNCITSLALENDLVISSSEDYTLRVWQWREGICLKVLETRELLVNIEFSDSFIATSSMKTILIWNWKTEKQEVILDLNRDDFSLIYAISLEGSIVAWSTNKGVVSVMNWQTKENLYKLEDFFYKDCHLKDVSFVNVYIKENILVFSHNANNSENSWIHVCDWRNKKFRTIIHERGNRRLSTNIKAVVHKSKLISNTTDSIAVFDFIKKTDREAQVSMGRLLDLFKCRFTYPFLN